MILAKRLAQCLHPALPSGVHLKTLEVYETIFQMIDKRQLQRDLVLFTYGLFPLLSSAALPVKPILLDLYETHFLPLGQGLEPVLTAFIIGLLSSLEEGVDYFDRVVLLLDRLANQIDEFYFYTCLWSSMFFVSSVRYPAIVFIRNHFNEQKSSNELQFLRGSSDEIMVKKKNQRQLFTV